MGVPMMMGVPVPPVSVAAGPPAMATVGATPATAPGRRKRTQEEISKDARREKRQREYQDLVQKEELIAAKAGRNPKRILPPENSSDDDENDEKSQVAKKANPTASSTAPAVQETPAMAAAGQHQQMTT